MRRIIVIPSDPILAYIKGGKTYEYLDDYFNPGGYFDEVFCLSPWGENEKIGRINYIQANPRKFHSVIQKIKPDVVRAYDGFKCADWACVSRVRNIPVVVSVHDTNPQLIHNSLKYADAVICMAEAVKSAVCKKVAVEENRIFIMPNRVDVELFSKKVDKDFFDNLDKLYGEGKHILHVGRKAKQKNIDTLIKAMLKLPEEYNAVFVGRGNADTYKELAQKLHVENRCYFIDSVQKTDLPYYYSWCDCMCTPSRWEGFGFVFIEAAACECAIVTSDIGPMNEYLTNEKDALLVEDYENPEKLAEAIMRACSVTEAITKMKRAARQVGLMFEKSKVDKQEIEIYQRIIEEGSSNRYCFDLSALKRTIFYK